MTTKFSRDWLQVAMYFGLIAVCAFGSTFVSQVALGKGAGAQTQWLTKCLLVMLSVTLTTGYFLRRSGQCWRLYGVRRSQFAADSATGLLTGLLLATVWGGVLWLNMHFRLEKNPGFSAISLLLASLATIGMGIGEEVGYRSYGFARLRSLGGAAAAVLLPTILFVGVHVAGGVPLLAGLLVVGSSSVLYGILMLTVRSLPFVAAFHIGNNLMQDTFFRTSSGSLFRPRFAAAPYVAPEIRIWIGIALVNLACAFVLLHRADGIARRGQASEKGYSERFVDVRK